MKKLNVFLLTILFMLFLNHINTIAMGSNVLFNGALWDLSYKSFVENGITYVDAIECFDKYGYSYNIESNTINIEKDGRNLIFNIGFKDYIDQSKCKIMENAIIKKDSVVYVPLRFFSELNSHNVTWSNETKSIEITSSNLEETLELAEVETIAEEPKTSIIPQHFVDLNGTYYLESIEQDLKFASEYYKDITHLEVIGRTLEERPIYAIRIGTDTGIEKPCILLLANIHAREDFSSMLSMKMLDYILYSYNDSGYFGTYDVKDILSKIDIWFIPVANPDGLNITQYGFYGSKNYSELIKMANIPNDYRWWKANANGVDLNRNFDDGNWSIKTSYPVKSSEGYKGPYPNSELETIAIQTFCNDKLPLMSISYHTSGNTMYWADSKTHLYFEGVDTSITKKMASLTGYSIMPLSKNPIEYSSGFENWFRARFNRISICMELSPSIAKPYVQHDDIKFDSLVWNKSKYTGLQLALEALQHKDNMYEVYQLGNYVKTFYSKEKAENHAQYFLDSYIMNKGSIVE